MAARGAAERAPGARDSRGSTQAYKQLKAERDELTLSRAEEKAALEAKVDSLQYDVKTKDTSIAQLRQLVDLQALAALESLDIARPALPTADEDADGDDEDGDAATAADGADGTASAEDAAADGEADGGDEAPPAKSSERPPDAASAAASVMDFGAALSWGSLVPGKGSSAKKAQIKHLCALVSKVTLELRDMAAMVRDKSAALQTAQAELASIKEERKTLAQRVRRVEAALGRVHSDKVRLEKEAAEHGKALEEQVVRFHEERSRNEDLVKQLMETETRAADLSRQLTQRDESERGAARDLQAQIEELEKQNADMRYLVTFKANQAEEMLATHRSTDVLLCKKSVELAECQAQVDELEAVKAALEEQLAMFRNDESVVGDESSIASDAQGAQTGGGDAQAAGDADSSLAYYNPLAWLPNPSSWFTGRRRTSADEDDDVLAEGKPEEEKADDVGSEDSMEAILDGSEARGDL